MEDAEDDLIYGALPMNACLEQFSIGFVRMVAAAAGCSVKSHATDYDGVDITVTSSADYEVWHGAEIELQLKCTRRQGVLHGDHLSWQMETNALRKLTLKRFTPAVLGVLLVPREDDHLLELDEHHLRTESRMYWEHARNLDQHVGADQASKTVLLPRSNLFDVPNLLKIMQVVGEGGVR